MPTGFAKQGDASAAYARGWRDATAAHVGMALLGAGMFALVLVPFCIFLARRPEPTRWRLPLSWGARPPS
jgi:hypothetical protein